MSRPGASHLVRVRVRGRGRGRVRVRLRVRVRVSVRGLGLSHLPLAPGGAIGQPLDPVAAPSAQGDDHEVVQQLAHLR